MGLMSVGARQADGLQRTAKLEQAISTASDREGLRDAAQAGAPSRLRAALAACRVPASDMRFLCTPTLRVNPQLKFM